MLSVSTKQLIRIAIRIAGIVMLTLPLMAPKLVDAASKTHKSAIKSKQAAKKKAASAKHTKARKAKKTRLPHSVSKKARLKKAIAPKGKMTNKRLKPFTARRNTATQARPAKIDVAPKRVGTARPVSPTVNEGKEVAAKTACQRNGRIYLLADCNTVSLPDASR